MLNGPTQTNDDALLSEGKKGTSSTTVQLQSTDPSAASRWWQVDLGVVYDITKVTTNWTSSTAGTCFNTRSA
jgi:hypothetical protein